MKVANFEHPVGGKNRNKILGALMNIGNSAPHEIKKFLDDEARKLIENQASSTFISADEKKELIKKQTVTERTIFEWLGRLKKQGLVIHEDNKYRLSSQVTSDVDFMAGFFGLNIILYTLPAKDKTSLEERLLDIVDSFGVSIVYILIYCLQPFRDTNYDYDTTKLEDFRNRWADTAIPSKYLLTLLRDQLGLLKSPMKSDYKELGRVNYEKLIRSLESKYPEIMNKVNQATEDLHKAILSKINKG